jgi:hypothetical protein
MSMDKNKFGLGGPPPSPANWNDFIFFDENHKPMRVLKFVEVDPYRVEFHLHDLVVDERNQRHWHKLINVSAEDAARYHLRAIPDALTMDQEYGMPFLPAPQMTMFNAIAPHYGDCLLIPDEPDRGDIAVEVIEATKDIRFRRMSARFISSKLPGNWPITFFNLD